MNSKAPRSFMATLRVAVIVRVRRDHAVDVPCLHCLEYCNQGIRYLFGGSRVTRGDDPADHR